MKLRKKVEMLFTQLKRILGLGRLRLRGPCGANDEFLLAATAQNLRTLANIFPAPQQMFKASQERRLGPVQHSFFYARNTLFSNRIGAKRINTFCFSKQDASGHVRCEFYLIQ